MSSDNHIAKNKFYEVLEKRLQEYREGIFGNRMTLGINLDMLQAMLYSSNQLKMIDSQTSLFG